MQITPDIFAYVRNSIEKTAYRTVCDDFYCGYFRKHFADKDTSRESMRLVKKWSLLNAKTYAGRYQEDEVNDLSEFIPQWLRDTTAVQTFKFLQCIRYNIEREYLQLSAEDAADLKLLELYIDEMNSAIMGQLPEYKAAKWSDLPTPSYSNN